MKMIRYKETLDEIWDIMWPNGEVDDHEWDIGCLEQIAEALRNLKTEHMKKHPDEPRYIVLKGPLTQLVRDINRYIENGYKPTGGVFEVKKAATYTRYGQAMWRPEPEE